MTPPALSVLSFREAQAHARYGAFPGAATRRFGPLVAVYAGPGLPLNAAWHDGQGTPTAGDWADFEAFCEEHGVEPLVHLLSDAAPALLAALRGRGYALTSALHLYTHDLQHLTQPSLTVTEETDPEAWAALAAQGFGPGQQEVMKRVASAPQTRLFAAWLEGEPVAAGALSLVGGGAALHGASTLPAFRGRGAQSSLLAARLRVARDEGADVASVFVTPGGASERNLRRLGFTLTGARLSLAGPSAPRPAPPPPSPPAPAP